MKKNLSVSGVFLASTVLFFAACQSTSEKAEQAKPLYEKLEKENLDKAAKNAVYRSLLELNPQDPVVTKELGVLERNKLNYELWSARWKKAEAEKDVATLKKEIRWVFENNLYSVDNYGLDYILIYKAIRRVDPRDMEARVALGQEPYQGSVEQYRGRKLTVDQFCQAKELEWANR